MIANRVANAMAALGIPPAEVVIVEREKCAGKCGDIARYTTDELGYLVVAPCDTCARRNGNRSTSFVRRDVERELADVLLFFRTRWGRGTSRRQFVLLKARVDAIAAHVQLPALLPAGWKPEPPPRPPKPERAPKAKPSRTPRVCRDDDCANIVSGKNFLCATCKAKREQRRLERACHTPGCTKQPKIYKRFCVSCQARRDAPRERPCREPGCTATVTGRTPLCEPHRIAHAQKPARQCPTPGCGNLLERLARTCASCRTAAARAKQAIAVTVRATPRADATGKSLGGTKQGFYEHRCECGFITRGNVSWAMHRKRWCRLLSKQEGTQ